MFMLRFHYIFYSGKLRYSIHNVYSLYLRYSEYDLKKNLLKISFFVSSDILYQTGSVMLPY